MAEKEYIEREAAIDLLHYHADETCSAAVSDFEAIPAADVVPKSEVDRLKAEIHSLTKNSILTKYPHCVLYDTGAILTRSIDEYEKLIADISSEATKELAEENERLQETCDRYDLIVRSAAKVSEATRAEVIDEFAELAKKVLSRNTHKAIDQIAKEMTEAKE